MGHFIRIWQELDIKEIEKNLLVVGELSSRCFSCSHIGIENIVSSCAQCGSKFLYVGFMRPVTSKLLREVKEKLPSAVIIDFSDFKREIGKDKAKNIFK